MSRVTYENRPYPSAWRSLSSVAQTLPLKLSCTLAVVLVAIQIALFTAPPAQALSLERRFENPPALKPSEFLGDIIQTRTELLETAQDSEVRQKVFDFNIKCNPGQLYNPLSNHEDDVNLRSYVGTDIDPNAPYVAPTIEVKPGETIRIDLDNQLGVSERCLKIAEEESFPDLPQHFNSTNIHSHGFWISPDGHSDNVLKSIEPGTKDYYQYDLPAEHPAGTFWYHPHRHESTASQVSSGMVGALIVRGDRLPSKTTTGDIKTGDIDTLLKTLITDDEDKVLVLQQIQYACYNKNGTIKKGSDEKTWICESKDNAEDTNDIGGIEDNKNFEFGEKWVESGRYTSINGKVLPTFETKVGEVERWRMIHAGVRDTIRVEFRQLVADAPNIEGLKDKDKVKGYVKKYCTGLPFTYHIIANDGLTRSQAGKTSQETLQPGYRSDALMVFPEKGEYCMVDVKDLSNSAKVSDQLLGFVKVDAADDGSTALQTGIHAYLVEQLKHAAEQTMPMDIKNDILKDIDNNIKLTAFVPHPTIGDDEVEVKQADGTVEKNTQELAFNIDTTLNLFQVGNCLASDTKCQFKSYDGQLDRALVRGTADEWTLTSKFADHPFHIHVNPFQIVKILDPTSRDVSLPTAKDIVKPKSDETTWYEDPQYPGLKGVWKDTIWVKQGYQVVVRTRYERFDGTFVLHCHILEHEDKGMMQKIQIVSPKQ